MPFYPVVLAGFYWSPAHSCLEPVCLYFCRGSLLLEFGLLWFVVCCLFDRCGSFWFEFGLCFGVYYLFGRLRLPLLLFDVCCGLVECLLLAERCSDLAAFGPPVGFLFVVLPVVVHCGLALSGLLVVSLFLVVLVVAVCFGFARCGLLVVVLFVVVSVVGVCCIRVVFHVL